MRYLAFLLALALPISAQARIATLGIQSGYPDLAGVHLSLWPIDQLTVDAQGTLASTDAGMTAHLGPLRSERNRLLIAALAGYYTWRWGFIADKGLRITLQAGYGYEAERWELRLLVGCNFAPRFGYGPAGTVIFGWLI